MRKIIHLWDDLNEKWQTYWSYRKSLRYSSEVIWVLKECNNPIYFRNIVSSFVNWRVYGSWWVLESVKMVYYRSLQKWRTSCEIMLSSIPNSECNLRWSSRLLQNHNIYTFIVISIFEPYVRVIPWEVIQLVHPPSLNESLLSLLTFHWC